MIPWSLKNELKKFVILCLLENKSTDLSVDTDIDIDIFADEVIIGNKFSFFFSVSA